jgi:hypothetical protein
VAWTASPTLGAAATLVIQFTIGTLLFAVIAGLAGSLHVLIDYFHSHNLFPPMVERGMGGLELFVWGADVLCFVMFLVVEVRRFGVTMWKEWKV